MTPHQSPDAISRAHVVERLTRLAIVWEAKLELGGIRDAATKQELKDTIGPGYMFETAGNPAYAVCAEDLREVIRELQGPQEWPKGGLPKVTP